MMLNQMYSSVQTLHEFLLTLDPSSQLKDTLCTPQDKPRYMYSAIFIELEICAGCLSTVSASRPPGLTKHAPALLKSTSVFILLLFTNQIVT